MRTRYRRQGAAADPETDVRGRGHLVAACLVKAIGHGAIEAVDPIPPGAARIGVRAEAVALHQQHADLVLVVVVDRVQAQQPIIPLHVAQAVQLHHRRVVQEAVGGARHHHAFPREPRIVQEVQRLVRADAGGLHHVLHRIAPHHLHVAAVEAEVAVDRIGSAPVAQPERDVAPGDVQGVQGPVLLGVEREAAHQ